MRVLLFTGKGGVGKTTAAAATAARAAATGHKTLLVSTDAAHSLAEVLSVPLGPEPVEVDTGLAAQQVDTQRAFERSWREIQAWLVALLDAGGVDPVRAEELTVLPGAEEVLALLEVHRQVGAGRYDLVVVDCAPTAETLRLLALPEALRWWIDKVLPVEWRVVRSLRPVLSRVSQLPVPGDRVFEAVSRLTAQLGEVGQLLTDPAITAVRLVLTPEEVVVAEARRSFTTLSLYGYRVDGVVANRVFSGGSSDPWLARWAAAQAGVLAGVKEGFAPLPVWQLPYQEAEPVGLAELARLGGALYGGLDPVGDGGLDGPLSVERTTDGFALSLALPFATKGEVSLTRSGDELVVTVGSYRRVLALPSALRRCDVAGARLADSRLVVRFVPDPDLWMSP
ncbi:MAG: ArsA family ATPase [Mycobacteriales bacterium]